MRQFKFITKESAKGFAESLNSYGVHNTRIGRSVFFFATKDEMNSIENRYFEK